MSDHKTDTDSYESWLQELWAENVKRFDRTVLGLAGSALALSVTFARDLARTPPEQPALLAWAWILLLVSLLLVVASYIPSKVAVEARMQLKEKRADRWSIWAWWLSITGGVAFAAGAGLLARFAFVNMT